MDDGTDHKNGPAFRSDQGRDSVHSPKPIFFQRRSLLKALVPGIVGVTFFPAPLLAQEIPPPLSSPSSRFLVKYPWMKPWVERGEFTTQELTSLLGDIKPDRRVVKWMNHQAEFKPYYKYRKLFITSQRIKSGRERLKEYGVVLKAIEKRYGVPPEVVVALWGIESNFGDRTGIFFVLRTLFTLSTNYPRRAKFFREQLRHFLLLCQEEGFDPHTLKGSYAGAMGQVQMIPSTMRRYAVDFDGDGRRDVFGTPQDVLASIASFLHGHGWKAGAFYTLPPVAEGDLKPLVSSSLRKMKPWHWWQEQGINLEEGRSAPTADTLAGLIRLKETSGSRYHMVFNNFRVVTQWNRSSRFAMVVQELASQIRMIH